MRKVIRLLPAMLWLAWPVSALAHQTGVQTCKLLATSVALSAAATPIGACSIQPVSNAGPGKTFADWHGVVEVQTTTPPTWIKYFLIDGLSPKHPAPSCTDPTSYNYKSTEYQIRGASLRANGFKEIPVVGVLSGLSAGSGPNNFALCAYTSGDGSGIQSIHPVDTNEGTASLMQLKTLSSNP